MKRIISVLFIILLLFSLCSCTQEPVKTQFFAMDTIMTLTVYGENADTAAEKAKNEVLRLEKLLSVTDENSTVSQINSSDGKVISVTDDILIPIKAAKEINTLSKGALNITMLPLSQAWGFLSKDYRVPNNSELELLLQKANMDNIVLSDNGVSCINGTRIDLGSVAKGYAAQRIIDILSQHEITSAVISLGGNVQTLGTKPDGSLWNITVADPLHSDTQTAGTLHTAQTAVVTSGAYQRNFDINGKTYHHILDPKTGYPSDSDLLSVTVLCENGTYADGLSTALFVMGSEKAYELYLSKEIIFEAVFITKNNEIILTEGIKDNFTLNENGTYHYAESHQ